MSKRVNITYSVEFEKILETMRELINKTYVSEYRSLDKNFNELLTALGEEGEKEALQKIEEIRHKLMNLDFCLNDCYDIVSDYQKKLLTPEEKNNDIG